jgi:CO/xanthine dehydrogenase FAD-binding subunit
MPLGVTRADSARKAAAILKSSPGARFVGGGTLVVRDVTAGDPAIDQLVLSDGLGLETIGVADGRVTLGAAATMAAVLRHPDLGFLAPVAGAIGGPAVRAMATIGGNLFAPYPYGDFAVALLALGAEVEIVDPKRTASVSLERFLATAPTPGRIVRSLSFALPSPGAFRFAKVIRRKPHGASVLAIAALLPEAERKVVGARIAYGAMAPKPMRARAVERALEGRPLDQAAIAAAVKVAAEGCAPLTDPQASAWYRLNVLPVHLKRLLEG